MRRRVLLAFVALGLLASTPSQGEVGGSVGISVTSTSATTTFTVRVSTVCLINCATAGPTGCSSANKLFARIFTTTETPAAATTSSPIRLEPGESVCLSHPTSRSQSGSGWLAVSYVTAAAETATLKLLIQ